MSALEVKILAARAVGELARRAGRGGGTSLPGKALSRLDAHAIERLAARLPRGSAIISATNGKTTSAPRAGAVLDRAASLGGPNQAGPTQAGGTASARRSAAGPG